jgi:hypothetical protein
MENAKRTHFSGLNAITAMSSEIENEPIFASVYRRNEEPVVVPCKLNFAPVPDVRPSPEYHLI